MAFKITVTDTDTGKEYSYGPFEGFYAEQERGILRRASPTKPGIYDHMPNGHDRLMIRTWSGIEKWEDFRKKELFSGRADGPGHVERWREEQKKLKPRPTIVRSDGGRDVELMLLGRPLFLDENHVYRRHFDFQCLHNNAETHISEMTVSVVTAALMLKDAVALEKGFRFLPEDCHWEMHEDLLRLCLKDCPARGIVFGMVTDKQDDRFLRNALSNLRVDAYFADGVVGL